MTQCVVILTFPISHIFKSRVATLGGGLIMAYCASLRSDRPGFEPSDPYFFKSPETFQAHKAIFNKSVSREVYTRDTFGMKGTSVHIKM